MSARNSRRGRGGNGISVTRDWGDDAHDQGGAAVDAWDDVTQVSFTLDHQGNQLADDARPPPPSANLADGGVGEAASPWKLAGGLLLPGHIAVDDETAPGREADMTRGRPGEQEPATPHEEEDELAEGEMGDYVQLDADRDTAMPRYYDAEQKAERMALEECPVCGELGHDKRSCTHVQCLACGAIDEHTTRDCPLGLSCWRCGGTGHKSRDCPMPRAPRGRNGYNGWPSGCDRCGSTAHGSLKCPTLWRIYVYNSDSEYRRSRRRAAAALIREQERQGGGFRDEDDSATASSSGREEGEIDESSSSSSVSTSPAPGEEASAANGRGKPRKRRRRDISPRPEWDPATIWCYNCARAGKHWGDDCTERRYNPTRATGDPSAFSDFLSRSGPFARTLAPSRHAYPSVKPRDDAVLQAAAGDPYRRFDFLVDDTATMAISTDLGARASAIGGAEAAVDEMLRRAPTQRERKREAEQRARQRNAEKGDRGRSASAAGQKKPGRLPVIGDSDDDEEEGEEAEEEDWFSKRSRRNSGKADGRAATSKKASEQDDGEADSRLGRRAGGELPRWAKSAVKVFGPTRELSARDYAQVDSYFFSANKDDLPPLPAGVRRNHRFDGKDFRRIAKKVGEQEANRIRALEREREEQERLRRNVLEGRIPASRLPRGDRISKGHGGKQRRHADDDDDDDDESDFSSSDEDGSVEGPGTSRSSRRGGRRARTKKAAASAGTAVGFIELPGRGREEQREAPSRRDKAKHAKREAQSRRHVEGHAKRKEGKESGRRRRDAVEGALDSDDARERSPAPKRAKGDDKRDERRKAKKDEKQRRREQSRRDRERQQRSDSDRQSRRARDGAARGEPSFGPFSLDGDEGGSGGGGDEVVFLSASKRSAGVRKAERKRRSAPAEPESKGDARVGKKRRATSTTAAPQ